MADDLLTPEIEAIIGKEIVTHAEVEKGAIARFAEALDDPNPLYRDERRARKTRFGGIIAPPTFLRALASSEWVTNSVMNITSSATRVLNGGNELHLYDAVRVGDRLAVTHKLSEAYVKEGKLGRMLFMVYDIIFVNQFGDLVARVRNTAIRY